MKKVLFVCIANNGRSQIAEALYNQLTNSNLAKSGGTDLSHGSQGADSVYIPKSVATILEEVGTDTTSIRRKKVTPEMANDADVIISMSQRPLPDYLEKSPKLIHWEVEDGKGKDLDFQRRMRDQIRSLCQSLIKAGS